MKYEKKSKILERERERERERDFQSRREIKETTEEMFSEADSN